MRKLLSFCIIAGQGLFICLCVMLLLYLMVGCATLQPSQPQLQTYTFNYDGHEYSALLPEEVPLPPDNAQVFPYSHTRQNTVYVMHVHYMARIKPILEYPVLSVWFTPKLGVVGLIWHHFKPDGTHEDKGFKYANGRPVPVNTEEFQALINGILYADKPIDGKKT